MAPSLIRGAVVQMVCAAGKVQENTAKALGYARQAVADGATLIVLPELFNTGYGFPELDLVLAEPIPGPTSAACQEFCDETGAMLVTAILERAGKKLYDTAIAFRARLRPRTYRKVHLFKGEEKRWQRGSRIGPPVPFHRTRVGMLICHDVRYAEAARTLALAGAQILAYPSAFGAPRFYSWDNQTRARAMENGVFAMFADRAGQDGDIKFAGHSRIVDPFGKPIVDLAEDVEGYAIADMDLSLIQKARDEVPQLPQINTRVYRYICAAGAGRNIPIKGRPGRATVG